MNSSSIDMGRVLPLEYDEVKYLKSILSNKYSLNMSYEIDKLKITKAKRQSISRSSYGFHDHFTNYTIIFT